jgi:hypothetical protein
VNVKLFQLFMNLLRVDLLYVETICIVVVQSLNVLLIFKGVQMELILELRLDIGIHLRARELFVVLIEEVAILC